MKCFQRMLFGLSGLLLVAGTALGQVGGRGVMGRIPGSSAFFLIVPNMQTLDLQVGAVARQALGMHLPPLQALVGMAAPGPAGRQLDTNGGLAVVVPTIAPGHSPAYVLLAARNASALIKALPGAKAAGQGLTSASVHGRTIYAKAAGHYVVIASERAVVAHYQPPAQPVNFAKQAGPVGGRLLTHSAAAIFINVGMLGKRFGPMAAMMIGMQMQALRAQGANHPAAAKKLKRLKAEQRLAKALMQDSQTAVIGLSATGGGIKMTAALQYKPGASEAHALTAEQVIGWLKAMGKVKPGVMQVDGKNVEEIQFPAAHMAPMGGGMGAPGAPPAGAFGHQTTGKRGGHGPGGGGPGAMGMSGRPGAMSMTSSVQPRPVYLVEDNGTATLVAGGQKSRVKQVLANGLPGVANELSSGAPVVFYGLVPGPKPMAVGMALGNSPGGTTVTLFVPGAAMAGIKPMLGMMMGHMAGGPPMQGPGMPGPGMNNQGRGMPGAAVNHRTRTRVSTATPVVQARPNPNTAMQKQTHVPTKAPSTAKPKKMHVSRALAKRLRTELSMGKYYVSIGDASMAKTCLDNIVQRVPGTRWARKAKRALAKLKQRNDG